MNAGPEGRVHLRVFARGAKPAAYGYSIVRITLAGAPAAIE